MDYNQSLITSRFIISDYGFVKYVGRQEELHETARAFLRVLQDEVDKYISAKIEVDLASYRLNRFANMVKGKKLSPKPEYPIPRKRTRKIV